MILGQPAAGAVDHGVDGARGQPAALGAHDLLAAPALQEDPAEDAHRAPVLLRAELGVDQRGAAVAQEGIVAADQTLPVRRMTWMKDRTALIALGMRIHRLSSREGREVTPEAKEETTERRPRKAGGTERELFYIALRNRAQGRPPRR